MYWVWGAVGGLMIGVFVLLLILVFRDDSPQGPGRGGGGGGGGSPTAPPSGDGDVVVADEPVPGVGGPVHLAGGIATVPVPTGWTLLSRGNSSEDPGGYSESAVLVHDASGVRLAAYILARSIDPAAAGAAASEEARSWTRDGEQVAFGGPEDLGPRGAIAAVADVRYRYVRGGPKEGMVVVAVRSGGLALMVAVEMPDGRFDATRDVWRPLLDAVVNDFGGVA